MTYWWASQNKNYRTAIPDGTLWTRPRVDGVLPKNRAALQKLEPDDIVFHYGKAHVRAVSRVLTTAIDSPRPAGYPRGPLETEAHDDGKLARVELIADDLMLHRGRVSDLIAWGAPGPLSVHGIPREAYLSPLTPVDAEALLRELDVSIPRRSLPGRPHENWTSVPGITDATAIAKIRIEQGALRAYLLDGRTRRACAICGRHIPAELLVAGHIVPRAGLNDEERRQYDSVAMLVCLLGCDALFEHGYLVVDSDGRVAPGHSTDDAAITMEVAARVGAESPAWRSSTAASFRVHEKMHSASY
jgi:hypothetical protein